MRIPGYKVQRLIAEGGMAAVYLAIQESLERPVALKLLKKFDTEEQSRRFFNEGRIIAALNHRNIITIHDIGVVADRPYISMEYLKGGDLEARIGAGITIDQALDILEQIGECLDFVHRQGIVHRDIKPANILFHGDGTPILTDFGIAKQLDIDSKLTADGTAMGSPDYFSPEQAECKPLDGRTDIYSLGILFYEMLVGQTPYRGDSYIKIIMAHLSEPIPDLPTRFQHYQDLLNRMIAKHADDRFGSAEELVEHIQALRHATPLQRAEKKVAALIQDVRDSEAATGAVAHASGAVRRWYGKLNDYLPDGQWRWGLAALPLVLLAVLLGWPNREPASPEPSTTVADGAQATASSTPADSSKRPHAPVSLPVAETASRDRNAASAVGIGAETTQLRSYSKGEGARQQDIERYLLLAQLALEEDKLTTPERDSARYYYQRALSLAPDHEEAMNGLTKIVERYAELAEGALYDLNYVAAKRYVKRGLSLQPDHERLLSLSERTNPAKDVPKRVIGGIKSFFR